MIEVYNNYSSLGILSRPITYGEEFQMVRQFIMLVHYRQREHIRSKEHRSGRSENKQMECRYAAGNPK